MGPEALRLLRFVIRYPTTWHDFSKGNPQKTRRALQRLEDYCLVETTVKGGVKMFRLACPEYLLAIPDLLKACDQVMLAAKPMNRVFDNIHG